MRKSRLQKRIFMGIVAFMVFIQPIVPVHAMTIYESDSVYHEEGYIFIGESHSVLAAHAVGTKADEVGNVFHPDDNVSVSFEYRWDGSREVTPDGSLNTFTMKGNLFFVFEGNNAETDAPTQTSQQYIYSDGNGKRGRGVEKIHEIMDSNSNIAHWNIISFHGAVSASKGTKAVSDFYVDSYRNWIEYEFPDADCYFLSVATMTKYYKSTPDKKIFNDTIKSAFPEQFLDYTDFYASRTSQRMVDTIHWDDDTYIDLIFDVIQKVSPKRQETEGVTEYAVMEVQEVFYTNDATVIYSEPALESSVVLPFCEPGIPVQVTGITSSGFFRVCVHADGTDSYIPVAGLVQ